MTTVTTVTYEIEISDDYVVPTGTIDSNEEYIDFVMNKAAESYKKQYDTKTSNDGITAARETYNASVPAPVETPVVPEVPEVPEVPSANTTV